MKRPASLSLSICLALAFGVFSLNLAGATSVPGTLPTAASISSSAIQTHSLTPIVNETGHISWSIDGAGYNESTGTIRVDKPVGATVRKAYLAAATTPYSNTLGNGDVTLDGLPVNWSIVQPGAIGNTNAWADVTAMVKPKIDAAQPPVTALQTNTAAPIRVTFTVGEANTYATDGEILVVIFDDPNVTINNTIALLFGAQAVNGDTFAIHFAQPVTDPTLKLDMSLGISFGYQQPGNCGQYSEVDVNGQRLSTMAGGQDDSLDGPYAGNGTLITVGGIGDSDANPPDPYDNSCPQGDRSDDELYNLNPFAPVGTSDISVHTLNPSNDDNIFFAAFNLNGETASVTNTGGSPAQPLTVTKTVDSTPVQAGAADGYTITVSNPNGKPISLSSITDTLPSGFTYTTGSSSGVTTSDPTISGQTLTWSLESSVPANGSVTLHFGVHVSSSPGDYTNQAGGTAVGDTVTGSGPTATVRVLAPLTTAKTADSSTTIPGGTNGYTITISNPNPWNVTLNSISDTLPSGFQYLSATTSGATTNDPAGTSALTWTGPFTVAANGSISLHFAVKVASTNGDYYNNASAQAQDSFVVKPAVNTAKVTVGGSYLSIPFGGNYKGLSNAWTTSGANCPPYCTTTGSGTGTATTPSLTLSTLSFSQNEDYSADPTQACATVKGTFTVTSSVSAGTSISGTLAGKSCSPVVGGVVDRRTHTESGTYTVTKGTGALTGASGSGTYSDTRSCASTGCSNTAQYPNNQLYHTFNWTFNNTTLIQPA